MPAPLTCDIEPGGAYVIITSGEEECMALTRLITGLVGCADGTLQVEGADISSLTHHELDRHRRRTGVVPPRDGLISNLKLWENITLPLLYHTGAVSPDAERQGQEWLKHFGYTGRLMTLPSLLSPSERRIAVWVRMLLTEPELVVYANSFDEMPVATLPPYLQTADDFHGASERRTTLYLTSHPEMAARFTADGTFATVPPHSTVSRAL
jgi:phospholipid/cholesterol/gamma-HCH transport system ATP-binding protein